MLDKTKFNQLVDDTARKFEVAQAVDFADLAKQAQLRAQFSQFQTQYIKYFNKFLLTEKKLQFTVLIGVI